MPDEMLLKQIQKICSAYRLMQEFVDDLALEPEEQALVEQAHARYVDAVNMLSAIYNLEVDNV